MQARILPVFVKGGQMYQATSRAWWLPHALRKAGDVVVARIAAQDASSRYLVDLTEDDLEKYQIVPGLICNDNGFVMDGERPRNNLAAEPVGQKKQREMTGWPLIDRGQLAGTESHWGMD